MVKKIHTEWFKTPFSPLAAQTKTFSEKSEYAILKSMKN